MEKIFQQAFHVPGTLAANLSLKWITPCDCQLYHVSAVVSPETASTLMVIGNSVSSVAYVASVIVGINAVPKEWKQANFVGAVYPHIPAGTTVIIGIDYDGVSGTAGADLTIILTYTEG
jgi:hypothetical protein